VVTAQVLIGSGIGMGWAHLGKLIMATAALPEKDVASSFIATTQFMAVAFGSAVAGIVANATGFVGATPGQVLNAGCWLFAVFSIAPSAALLTSRLTLRAIPIANMPG
jgi:hypothetical protein